MLEDDLSAKTYVSGLLSVKTYIRRLFSVKTLDDYYR